MPSTTHKPAPQFDGTEGIASKYKGGPDTIETDLAELAKMFDPAATHTGGDPGGIGAGNMQKNACDDTAIGDRTVDDTTATAYANTGALTQILSWFAKQLKAIVGGASWSSTPPDSLTGLDTRATANTNAISNLAGAGRTTETVKGNADNLTTHKAGSDHDGRYYTETELDAGQLDNRYFTETELTNGALDGRYYTETEISAKVDMTDGALKSVGGITNAKGDVDIVAGTGITVQKNSGTKRITIVATGEALPAAHASSHATGGTDEVTPASIGASADTHNHDSAYAPLTHTTAELPHLATDPTTSKVYRWGLAVQDGVWGYKYEEVV